MRVIERFGCTTPSHRFSYRPDISDRRIRFDHVYHSHFKCNKKAIHEYPNLWNYTKELAQLPGVVEADTSLSILRVL